MTKQIRKGPPRLRVVAQPEARKASPRERATAWVTRGLAVQVEREMGHGVKHVDARGRALKTPDAVVRRLLKEGFVRYSGVLLREVFALAVERREAFEQHAEECSECARSLN